jgi:hypothetical protein|tara:strand:- start:44 stop:154 length:111 start_codon:yes stop_codon:yes gene_type:complete
MTVKRHVFDGFLRSNPHALIAGVWALTEHFKNGDDA